MTIDRDTLKAGITALLDALALEHPLGHQPEYAGRYLLKCPSGAELELMFEKSSKTRPNLWCLEKAVASLSTSAIEQRRSPASSLYARPGRDGKANYGRTLVLRKCRS
jgi:hypothetical protein